MLNRLQSQNISIDKFEKDAINFKISIAYCKKKKNKEKQDFWIYSQNNIIKINLKFESPFAPYLKTKYVVHFTNAFFL